MNRTHVWLTVCICMLLALSLLAGCAKQEPAPGVDDTDTTAVSDTESTGSTDESETTSAESDSDTAGSDTETDESVADTTESETDPTTETEPSYDLLDSMTGWTDPVTQVPVTQPTTEDPALKLWFDHLTEKRARYDAPNEADLANTTYIIQMAKNEMEGCHFYLQHSNEKKVLIEYTPFTHASGATLATELGVEFYYEEGYMSLKGFTMGTTAATGNRIDAYPDGVIPYASYINPNYGGDEGGSYEYGAWVPIGPYSYKPWDTANFPFKDAIRGFVLQATSTAQSEVGQYSSTITVKDYNTGEVIKVANVYAYVYNVTLGDEPALDTAIGMWQASGAANSGGEIGYLTVYNMFGGYDTGEVVRACADFLLKYRLTPTYGTWAYTDVLCPTTEDGVWDTTWLENPRVTTIKVQSQELYNRIKALNNSEIYEKMFYYGQDEPCVPRNQMRTITLADGTTLSAHDTYGILSLIGVAEEAKMLQNTWGWTDYRLLIPYERDPVLGARPAFPNIDKTATTRLTWNQIRTSLSSDAAKALFDQYAEELKSSADMIEFMSKYVQVWTTIFPAYTPGALDSVAGTQYLQPSKIDNELGEYAARMEAYRENGELWNYVACNPTWNSPYQNILLFNDGTEARTMFWTMYKNGQTGFLYWREDYYPGVAANTYTLRDPFSKTGPGDGILIYPGATYGQVDPIPSLRLLNMRDGVEDYELLCMLEAKYGEAVAQELTQNIVTSVVTFTRDDDKIYDVRAHLLQLLAE